MTVEEHYRAIAPKLTNWLVATGSAYADACDLVQDVFAKLWKMKEDLRDNDSAVSGLAFTIARNLRKNRIRDNARFTLSAELAEDAAVAEAADELGNDDAAYLRQRLSEAFAMLPPVLRDAYTLFQIGGLSIREIARETGVTEGLVKVRIFRAKEKLRPLLEDLKENLK
jgi:RNA polymerase sigma-70 factor (ECF subfamily)